MAKRAVETIAYYRAWDTSANTWKTGDSTNHTLYWTKDGTASAATNSPSEVDGTNRPGLYSVTLTATETDCNSGSLGGVSSTSGIILFGDDYAFMYEAADSSGLVNVGKINSVSASSVTTINANIGTTEPVSFTGTGASALAKSDAVDVGGTAQTGADIGALLGTPAAASVSADIAAVKTDTAAVKTKTDSLTFTVSGVVDANVVDWKGSAAPAMPTNFADLSIDTDGNVSITANVKKNAAKSGFMFVMTDSTNHTPATGLTVSATRSLDGAAFASCANSASEVANGTYTIDLAAADTNGDHVMLRFTATGADDLNIEIITQP